MTTVTLNHVSECTFIWLWLTRASCSTQQSMYVVVFSWLNIVSFPLFLRGFCTAVLCVCRQSSWATSQRPYHRSRPAVAGRLGRSASFPLPRARLLACPTMPRRSCGRIRYGNNKKARLSKCCTPCVYFCPSPAVAVSVAIYTYVGCHIIVSWVRTVLLFTLFLGISLEQQPVYPLLLLMLQK